MPTEKEKEKQYRAANKKSILKAHVKYTKKRRETDIGFRILDSCRRRLNYAIKGQKYECTTN